MDWQRWSGEGIKDGSCVSGLDDLVGGIAGALGEGC